jgi:hypothetical protein
LGDPLHELQPRLAPNVASSHLVFVSGEGCQDFGLLALRHLDKVQGPSEFRCDLIEFCGGDPEVPVGLLIFAIAAVVDHFSDAVVKNPMVGQKSKNPQLREWHNKNLKRLPGLKFMRTLWVCNVSGGPFQFTATKPGTTALGLASSGGSHAEMPVRRAIQRSAALRAAAICAADRFSDREGRSFSWRGRSSWRA